MQNLPLLETGYHTILMDSIFYKKFTTKQSYDVFAVKVGRGRWARDGHPEDGGTGGMALYNTVQGNNKKRQREAMLRSSIAVACVYRFAAPFANFCGIRGAKVQFSLSN